MGCQVDPQHTVTLVYPQGTSRTLGVFDATTAEGIAFAHATAHRTSFLEFYGVIYPWAFVADVAVDPPLAERAS